MKTIWGFISYLGLDDRQRSLLSRNIVLANKINFIMLLLLILLNLLTAFIRYYNNGEYTIHTQKLLILLIFCILNIFFSFYKKHEITKSILIFVPTFVIVLLPIFLGYVQEIDLVYSPIIIIAFSFILQLLQKPELSNKLYIFSLLYFALLLIFLDNIIIYFSGNNINIIKIIKTESIYYKIVAITAFLFIQSTVYYLRNLNYKYEIDLQEHNEELKTTIEKLQSAQQQLIQSEKMASLGILTSGIAHEINNPLNFINGGILGIESYINENLSEHTENVSPLIEAIREGIIRVSNIVTSLNHYSKQDDLPRTNCNIHSIIDNCLIMLNNQFKDNIEVKRYYTDSVYSLIGSEGQLYRALLNIIANAGQSIENKGEVSISTYIENSHIFIIITDTGIGISSENLSKIYDPFFTTKEPGQGTGLGLSITIKIIQEHQGSLEIESEMGKGTKAIIKLPIT